MVGTYIFIIIIDGTKGKFEGFFTHDYLY